MENYIKSINYIESCFDTLGSTLLPNCYEKIVIYFYCLMFMEQIFLVRKRGMYNMRESLTSLSHGVLYESFRLFTSRLEIPIYYFIYQRGNYQVEYPLQDSTWIGWCIGFIVTDFCYYWVHRLKHKVNVLWIFHQVHHSSEVFELPVGVRQSVVELFYDYLFYLPLVIFINPYYVIKSRELIYIYQLLIHTELIGNLGHLEYIFNTPVHHSVHHANIHYCQNKNFGGVFIIWDQMFSTFQQIQMHKQIFYGVTESPEYDHVLYQQIHGIVNLFRKRSHLLSREKLWYKVLFKEPNWNLLTPHLQHRFVPVRQAEKDKDNTFKNLWEFHYICLAHYVIVINGLELYAVQNMDVMRIIRAFENMFISFCSTAFYVENSKLESCLISTLRSYLLLLHYYDYPEWCIHIYTSMLFYDLIYLMLIGLEILLNIQF